MFIGSRRADRQIEIDILSYITYIHAYPSIKIKFTRLDI